MQRDFQPYFICILVLDPQLPFHFFIEVWLTSSAPTLNKYCSKFWHQHTTMFISHRSRYEMFPGSSKVSFLPASVRYAQSASIFPEWRSIQSILKEISPEYSLEGLMLKLKLQYLATWCEEMTHWKDPDAGKDWRREEKGKKENEMVGWPPWHDGHEFG